MSIENLLQRLDKVKSTGNDRWTCKKLPSREYLHECFLLTKEGFLYWKERPLSHFEDKSMMTSFNKRYAGKRAGCDMGNGYLSVSINSSRYKAHRVVYHMAVGDVNEVSHIDHINGNPSDNRIENIRAATASTNSINFKGARSDSASLARGVTWKAKNKKWEAWACFQNKRIYLGLYGSKKEAEKAASLKRQELFGDSWGSQNGHQ